MSTVDPILCNTGGEVGIGFHKLTENNISNYDSTRKTRRQYNDDQAL